MKLNWTVVAFVLVLVSLIAIVVVLIISGENESVDKCSLLCERKSMDYFDHGYYTTGSWNVEYHYTCKCINNNGGLYEFER